MKRALLATTALAFAALAVPAVQAADTDAGGTAGAKSRTGYFERLDANKDGAVTLDEMVAAGQARFAKIDADGDGAVTRDEFLAYSAKARPAGAKTDEARKARLFDRLDTNKDGRITAIEGMTVVEKQFAALDADKDGKVTEDEMAAARERFRQQRESGKTRAN